MNYHSFSKKEQRIWENVYSMVYFKSKSASLASQTADKAVEDLKRIQEEDSGSDW